jgi:hypothetical protein
MIPWWCLFFPAIVGWIICARIVSGRLANLESELKYWHDQSDKMSKRFGVNLPLGPDKEE